MKGPRLASPLSSQIGLRVCGLGWGMESLGLKVYLDPKKGRQNDSPKPSNIAHQTIMLHTFGLAG